MLLLLEIKSLRQIMTRNKSWTVRKVIALHDSIEILLLHPESSKKKNTIY